LRDSMKKIDLNQTAAEIEMFAAWCHDDAFVHVTNMHFIRLLMEMPVAEMPTEQPRFQFVSIKRSL